MISALTAAALHRTESSTARASVAMLMHPMVQATREGRLLKNPGCLKVFRNFDTR